MISCSRPAARVWAASLAFAALWAFALVMNNVVARILGVTMLYYPVWPMPGNLIAGIGLAASACSWPTWPGLRA